MKQVSQGLAIMNQLKELEIQLNSVNDKPNLTYQAGYFYRTDKNSYYYVNNYKDDDEYFGTSFFVTIMQNNGKIEFGGQIPDKQKVKIIENFKNKIIQQSYIGGNSYILKDDIELHPDPYGDYMTDDCIHP